MFGLACSADRGDRITVMAEDIFDVVDENDQVIGQAERSRVHREGLRHRAVHVFLFDRRGRLFLQKRSQNKDSWPGAWDSSCSGHVDSGETYAEAVVRELGEELGWTPPEALAEVLKVDACSETGQEFVILYRGLADGPFDLNTDEIIGGDWLTPEEIDHRVRDRPDDYALSFRYLWSRFRARTKHL